MIADKGLKILPKARFSLKPRLPEIEEGRKRQFKTKIFFVSHLWTKLENNAIDCPLNWCPL